MMGDNNNKLMSDKQGRPNKLNFIINNSLDESLIQLASKDIF